MIHAGMLFTLCLPNDAPVATFRTPALARTGLFICLIGVIVFPAGAAEHGLVAKGIQLACGGHQIAQIGAVGGLYQSIL